MAAVMDANIKNHQFRAEARSYDSCLHASLQPDAIPVSVYHNLLAEVRDIGKQLTLVSDRLVRLEKELRAQLKEDAVD